MIKTKGNKMTTQTKRQPSSQSLVAKEIKKYVKSLGFKCKVKSDSFSGGDSVIVTLPEDMHPNTVAEIESHCSQYQYGHFNGMEDIYEHSNTRDDIPQTKFLFIRSEHSKELKQKAWDEIRTKWAGFEDAPEDFKGASNFRNTNMGEYGDRVVYRMLSAKPEENWSIGENFWKENCVKPTPSKKKQMTGKTGK